ncbi:S1C family serine protease [Algisphaera agarilytica]|uniref:PDZ domain-containing protein n=1 Tax=Algisphaera agarilytica TaxID=1385975 RepID=A0A7X0LLX7_9BACT|nr:PDZ domain-containing protein [Algisphaera agarilytica]MBB6431477.1 hypothetical protein [Algisphaera agarilytica]
MKSRFAVPTLIISAGLAGLHTAALAEDVPAIEPEAQPQADPAAADNAPGFLGVAVAETLAPPNAAPETPETVLVVSHVLPGSPADAAGLRSGDLLLKFDGQVMLHPTQLTRLVPTYPAGQEVELTLLRDGEQLSQPATLAERPAELGDRPAVAPRIEQPPFAEWEALPFELQPNNLQHDLQEMQQRMDRQFEQIWQIFREGLGEGWPGDDLWDNGDPIKLDFDLDLNNLPGNFGQSVTVLQDMAHKLTITQNQDGRHLKATDLEGNTLFEGPIDTTEQLNAVPEDIRTKIPEPGDNAMPELRRIVPENWPPFRQERPDNVEQPAPQGRAV